MTTRQLAAIALFLLAAAAHAQQYGPAPYVLYGWGEGGDGLGYGFHKAYLSQRTQQVTAKPQPDSEPWGRYDNSAPGYDSHGKQFTHAFYGSTPLEIHVTYVGAKPFRGRHPAELYYDRHGRPVYVEE